MCLVAASLRDPLCIPACPGIPLQYRCLTPPRPSATQHVPAHHLHISHTHTLACTLCALQGVLDLDTGCCEMEFDAEFCFTAGSLYTAPPLQVVTTLTSECSSGEIHNARGQRYNTQDGTATCVLCLKCVSW